MKVNLPEPVAAVLSILTEAGHEAYVVGGAVRDLLIEASTKDWDFTTSAKPEEVVKLFPESFYDNSFGTVGISGKHLLEITENKKTKDPIWSTHGWLDQVYEITTFRKEYGYSNRRHPDKIVWGKTVEEDLARRDFTINAMALKNSSTLPKQKNGFVDITVEIIDPFDGQKDLDGKLIKAVGDPDERFREDALRMMRAVRFGAQIGFVIENDTLKAIKKNSSLINEVSWERISQELLKIMGSDFAADGVTMLLNSGILEYILPETLAMRNVPQAGRHKLDVWHHSLESLRECPSTNPIVKLATFLHDIGKPISYREQGPRGITFYGHEVVGERIVRKISKRLRLSKKQTERLSTLVRWHMFTYDPKMTDAAIRRFIKRVGIENINDMMLLRVGDRKGGGSKATSWRLRELQQRIGEQLYEPMTLRDLKVNGEDVMNELKIKPGRKVGEIMNVLFDEVMEDTSKNNKEYLLKRIKELG
ncbi:CCA tRNA nucleotidyltransferase [Patescibacteria group bacterium]